MILLIFKKKLMKSFIFITILFVSSICNAQKNEVIVASSLIHSKDSLNDEGKIWTKVEQEAEFPGGNEGWRNFLVANLKIDSIAAFIYIPDSVKSISHKVILKFIISKDGSIKETVIESATDSYCAKEAFRVMKLSPKWRPAYQNGRTVNAYRRQPFTFYFEQE